jgi:capsular polysaccharide transport system permease protein
MSAPPADPASDPVVPPEQRPAQRPRLPRRRRLAAPRAISALVLREMSTRYGATPGGYLWAVAEPLGMIVILAIAFSVLVRSPSLGESFILFYATGYLPFHLFQQLSNLIMRSMMFSRPLLGYPVVTWMDTILARFVLNTATSVLVAYVMLAVILTLTDTRAVLEMGPIVMGFVMAMVLGLGIGALNCALVGLLPVWAQIWGIVTRPLFIISAVIFIMEDLPVAAREILWWNPLVHVTGLVRTGFYATYAPNYISGLYVWGVALVSMALGFVLLRRYHRDILSR